MSAETKQALEVAIAVHMADELNGAILTSWWIMAAGADMEQPEPGVTCYLYDGPTAQPFHVTFGLDRMSSAYLDKDYLDSQSD